MPMTSLFCYMRRTTQLILFIFLLKDPFSYSAIVQMISQVFSLNAPSNLCRRTSSFIVKVVLEVQQPMKLVRLAQVLRSKLINTHRQITPMFSQSLDRITAFLSRLASPISLRLLHPPRICSISCFRNQNCQEQATAIYLTMVCFQRCKPSLKDMSNFVTSWQCDHSRAILFYSQQIQPWLESFILPSKLHYSKHFWKDVSLHFDCYGFYPVLHLFLGHYLEETLSSLLLSQARARQTVLVLLSYLGSLVAFQAVQFLVQGFQKPLLFTDYCYILCEGC